jgi:hypothetical protein
MAIIQNVYKLFSLYMIEYSDSQWYLILVYSGVNVI